MSQNHVVFPIDPCPWGRARSEPKWKFSKVKGVTVRVHVNGSGTVHPQDVHKIQFRQFTAKKVISQEETALLPEEGT